jgi:site-specific DNA-methyltransferase (adenine-specific)
VYSFVPVIPLDEEWTDAKLYKRYGLTQDEIVFIQTQVAEHNAELFDTDATEEVEDE